MRWLFEVNTFAPIALTRLVMPGIVKHGGDVSSLLANAKRKSATTKNWRLRHPIDGARGNSLLAAPYKCRGRSRDD